MKKYQAGHEAEKPTSIAPMLIDVQVRQPHRDCPVYSWDREQERLRVTDVYRAEPGLPADLAILQLEGKLEVPVLLLSACSVPGGTLAQARLLGALSPTTVEEQERLYPSDDWLFVACNIRTYGFG